MSIFEAPFLRPSPLVLQGGALEYGLTSSGENVEQFQLLIQEIRWMFGM